MWYFLYNVGLIAASPIILTILLTKKRCRRGLPQRFGFHSPPPHDSVPTHRVIWIHAVSLGEVVAAVPFVRVLHARYPEHRLVVTTVTETGREAVEQRLAGIAEHRYVPLDFPWVVSKVIREWNPVLFVCVETELWPNLLKALSRQRVPVVLANGRLSSRSYRGYRLLCPLMRQVLASCTYCLMQTARDATRIIDLGAPAERVVCTGNIKFDQPLPALHEPGVDPFVRLVVAEDEELFVAGSTHPGEEEQLLTCYEALVAQFPNLVLLLAPRHIERAAQVEATAAARGLPVVRRSALPGDAIPRKRPRVIILDTRGELASVYRYGVLAFVGGTLAPIGGHNLLEPAMWGKPIFFGPHTDHCAETADLLIRAGGGRVAKHGAELAAQVSAVLHDRAALTRMGQAAQQVVADNRGALERTMEVVSRVLGAPSTATVREADLIGVQR